VLFNRINSYSLFQSACLEQAGKDQEGESNRGTKHLKIHEALKIKGVKQVLIAFFSYCALETTAGLWASSYLVLHQGIEAKVAARWASLFYLGITSGAF